MNKIIIFIAISLSVAYAQNWVLSWSDEFNEANIDTTKWQFDIGNNNGWGNGELEYYTDSSANAFIENGNLVIQALNENYNGFQYTSAKLTTGQTFNTIYGKFEMRAKLPYGQGIWPAFWMLGENIGTVGWPACGEIDIMELIGKDPQHVHGSSHGTGFDTTQSYYNADGFSNDFHVYGVNWQPDILSFYVDDTIYTTVTPSDIGGGTWPFNQNFFIILNLAIGGYWPGNPDSTTVFPQQYTIDYVRVWEIAM